MKTTKVRDCSRIVALIALILCLVLVTPGMLGSVATTQAAGMSIWTRLPLYGGNIYNIVIDQKTPSTLYAHIAGGDVFRSADSGGHWKEVNTGIANITKNSPSSSILYGKSPDGTIFSSTDNGDHWIVVNTASIVTADIRNIVVNPVTPSVLYALMESPQGYSTYGSNVFRSIDSGNHWMELNTGLMKNNNIISLVINPLIPTTLYIFVNENTGVIRSTDSGNNWMEVNTDLPKPDVVLSLVFDPCISTGMYAITGDYGIFHSVDNGDHWKAVNAGLPQRFSVMNLIFDPSTPTTLYALLEDGADSWPINGTNIFRSTDSGDHWAQIEGVPSDKIINFLVFDPKTSSTLYLGASDKGILCSTDSGTTWITENVGLDDLRVNALTIDSDTPSHMYVGTYSGVFKTVDAGKTWTEINTGITDARVTDIAINPLTPSILYAVAQNRVFRSVNSGTSWNMLNGGLGGANVVAIVIDPRTASTLYAATDDGVFRSMDSGNHWTAINSGLPQKGNTWDLNTQALAINPRTPATLYCSTRYNGLFRSYNSGTTWTAIDTPPSDYGVSCLIVDPLTPSILYANTGDRVYRSTNSGASWTMILDYKGAISSLVINPVTPSTVYVGTWNKAMRSTNRGTTWTTMNLGLTGSQFITFAAINPVILTILYAVTESRGVLRSTNDGTTWTAIDTPPSEYGISCLVVDPLTPSILYALDDGGIFRYGPVSSSTKVIQLKIGSTTMHVDGKAVPLEAAPIIMNSRTLVPLRALIETLGGRVVWSPSARTVDMFLGEHSVDVGVGGNIGYVNDKGVAIDPANPKVVPLIISGRTLLPLRFVTENFGCSVVWAAATKTITITYTP